MSVPNSSIVIGTASARAEHKGDLGKLVVLDGKTYRMVRANAAIAAAGNKVVARTAGTAGTWTVDVTTSANNFLVAGVIPPGQTGSTGTTGLISGDYLYIQVAGEATPLVLTAATIVGTQLSCSGTAGSCDPVTAVTTVPLGGVFATVLVQSVGVSGATQARLMNLI